MPLMDKLLGRSGEKDPEKEHHSHHHHGEPTSATDDYNSTSGTGRVDDRMEPGMNQQRYQSTQMPGSSGAGYGSNNPAGSDNSHRYDNNPSSGIGSNSNENRAHNTHSDGGAYYPPQGSAVGQPSDNTGPVHRNELMNKVDPRVPNDPAYRNQTSGEMGNSQAGYGEAGYNQPGQYQSGHHTMHDKTTQGSTNAGPYNSNLANRIDPRVDSDRSKEQYNTPDDSYGTTTTTTTTGTHTYVGPHGPNTTSLNQGEHYGESNIPSRRHEHGTEYGAAGVAGGAAAGYGSIAHNDIDLNRDDSIMNRGHPGHESHRERKEEKLERKEERKEEKRHGVDDYQNGPLPGPAPDTAGPHKSNLLNKLDPRVDSDDSKFGKEQEGYNDKSSKLHKERGGYGNESSGGLEHHRKHENQQYPDVTNTAAGVSQGTYGDQRYGNPMEQRLNDDPSSRRHHHEGINERRQEPYGNETSGYGNSRRQEGLSEGRQQGYGNENRHGNEDVHERRYEPSTGYAGQGQTTSLPQRKPVNESGTYSNETANVGSSQGQGNNTFQCAKCGHHNTHLFGRSGQDQKSNEYTQGSSNDRPAHNSSLMNKLDPRVPSSTTAESRSGVNPTGGNTSDNNPRTDEATAQKFLSISPEPQCISRRLAPIRASEAELKSPIWQTDSKARKPSESLLKTLIKLDALEEKRYDLAGWADDALLNSEVELLKVLDHLAEKFSRQIQCLTEAENLIDNPFAHQHLDLELHDDIGERRKAVVTVGDCMEKFQGVLAEEENKIARLWEAWFEIQSEMISLAVEVLGCDRVSFPREGIIGPLKSIVEHGRKEYKKTNDQYAKVQESLEMMSSELYTLHDQTSETVKAQQKAWRSERKKLMEHIKKALEDFEKAS